MATLLVLFALSWLLALLWLLLTARLLQRLANQEPEAYAALGSPVMRWLWWSWPEQRQGLPPHLSLTALLQSRVDLQTLYAPAEVGSMLRLGRWILLNQPRLAAGGKTRRLQRQLRLCAVGFAIGLAGVVVLGLTS